MLICQRNSDLQPALDSQEVDWTLAAQAFPNLDEAPLSPSSNSKQQNHTFTTSANPCSLQGKQLQVYTTVHEHFEADNPPTLRMIVSGSAGTAKSYFIHCFMLLLQNQLS